MARRWKPLARERIDVGLAVRRKKLAEKLAFAVEYGTEEEFVAAIKEFKPDIGKEELKTRITQFHAARREKRGL